MHRTLIYIGSLIVFFLMWGAFSFLIREPQTESTSRTMLSSIESNPIRPKGTTAAAIPITAGPQTARPDLLSDGLAGLAVLTMILILLNAANKPTTSYVNHKDSSEESSKKE